MEYEICADEAWTHSSPPLNRYWCFLGGLMGPQSEMDRLESLLKSITDRRKVFREVKYGSVTPEVLDCYLELIEQLFQYIRKSDLRYRQTFLDRSYVYCPAELSESRSDLDIQYRIYYQFIKHQFGLKYLPVDNSGMDHRIYIRLDDHSSQKHKDQLRKYIEELPNKYERNDMKVFVSYVNSRRLRRLQVCDLLMGAAGFYGNKMHLRRDSGKRGMKPNQAARHKLAKFIYGHLRLLDSDIRGSRAFNWFESTGKDGQWSNRLHHKIRIWKFIPRRYKIDAGWQNENLDSQGRYLGPQISPSIYDADDDN